MVGTLNTTKAVQNAWGALALSLPGTLFLQLMKVLARSNSQIKVLAPLLQYPARAPHKFFLKTEASKIQVFDNTLKNCTNLSDVISERIDVNQTICINGYFNEFLNTKHET